MRPVSCCRPWNSQSKHRGCDYGQYTFHGQKETMVLTLHENTVNDTALGLNAKFVR